MGSQSLSSSEEEEETTDGGVAAPSFETCAEEEFPRGQAGIQQGKYDPGAMEVPSMF